MKNPAFEFSLLSNAMDSLERVVELLAWNEGLNDGSRLKQAILLTAHGVELLLKERLRRVHPSLVWDDVDKYPRLDARTVGVDTAISRLASIGAVPVSEKDRKTIFALRNTRNAIEHFSWQTTTLEASHIVGSGLSFAMDFAERQLGTDLMYRFRDDDTWSVFITKNRKFVEAHEKRLLEKSKDNPVLVEECSFCNALARDMQTGACALCGHWEPGLGAQKESELDF